jgi:cytochrome c peroxidase
MQQTTKTTILLIFSIVFLNSSISKPVSTTLNKENTPDSIQKARIYLGKFLFFDPILSKNGKRSCASCHRPQKAFTDHRIVSKAFLPSENLDKNSPTLINAVRQSYFFHDARFDTVEQVFESVITHVKEFNHSYDGILMRLNGSIAYTDLLKSAFPAAKTYTRAEIDVCLKNYLSILRGGESDYDNYINHKKPMLDDAFKGYKLFEEAKCDNCHKLKQLPEPLVEEMRLVHLKTGPMKVPSLRNVALTEPYMHDGRSATLMSIFEDSTHNTFLKNKTVRLSQKECSLIVAFLHCLNDAPNLDISEPTSLPYVEGFAGRRIGGLY